MMVRSILMSRPVQDPQGPKTRKVRTARTLTWPFAAFAVSGALTIAGLTLDRMGKLPDRLARLVPGEIKTADLRSFARASRDADWVPYDTMRAQEFHKWCKRPDTPDCPDKEHAFDLSDPIESFDTEFAATRMAFIASLPQGSIKGASFRGADFSSSNLAGLHVRDVELSYSDFDRSILENAVIVAKEAVGVSFRGSWLRNAKVQFATAAGVDFRFADLKGVRIGGQVNGLFNFGSSANALSDANFMHAKFKNSYLTGGNAHTKAELANWVNERMFVLSIDPFEFKFEGTALRNVDFSNIDPENTSAWAVAVANSFADGTVTLPPGVGRPCQWLKQEMETEADFLAVWRAWLERGGESWPPVELAKGNWFAELGNSGSLEDIRNIQPAPRFLPSKEECDWVNTHRVERTKTP